MFVRQDFGQDFDHKLPSILEVTLDGQEQSDRCGIADARLFEWQGQPWVICSVNGDTRNSWPHVGPLVGNGLNLKRITYSSEPPEKNWMPFAADGQLYLSYTVFPHKILKADLDTFSAEDAFCTEAEQIPQFLTHGGAPPVLLPTGQFLGVANTQQFFWYQDRFYGSLLYLFDSKMPFRIQSVTPPVRFGGRKNRIHYCSVMTYDRQSDEVIFSLGLDDFDSEIIAVSLPEILELMRDLGEVNDQQDFESYF
jgi:hypothetical protein